MTARCHWLVAAGLLAAVGCGPHEAATTGSAAGELPTVTITSAPVQVRAVPRTVSAVGTLMGYDDATVAPRASGTVVRTFADVGDVVYPGEVLLEIDPVDALKDVDRARRALALELARLDLPELVSPYEFKTADVRTVQLAKATLDGAKLDYERVAGIKTASTAELDLARTALNVAEARHRVAESEARAGLTSAWLRKDELEVAEMRLADCTLRAPTPTGWHAWSAVVGVAANPLRYSVALKYVTEGERVQSNPSTSAFRLLNDRGLKFPALVPERHAGELKVGQFVEVRADAAPDRAVRGWIYRISAAVDPANRTFPVIVAVPNLDGSLKAGGFARATVRVRTDSGVKTVPPSAVVTFAGVTKVFVVEGGKARAIEVTIGTREKDWWEVIGNVPSGATVATSGHAQLVDGSPVKLRDETK